MVLGTLVAASSVAELLLSLLLADAFRCLKIVVVLSVVWFPKIKKTGMIQSAEATKATLSVLASTS